MKIRNAQQSRCLHLYSERSEESAVIPGAILYGETEMFESLA
jgi:hypothetical protein